MDIPSHDPAECDSARIVPSDIDLCTPEVQEVLLEGLLLGRLRDTSACWHLRESSQAFRAHVTHAVRLLEDDFHKEVESTIRENPLLRDLGTGVSVINSTMKLRERIFAL